jgi:hypothetical protein
VFHPSINEWNGRREVQLEIKDFHVEPTAADTTSPYPSYCAGPAPQPSGVD